MTFRRTQANERRGWPLSLWDALWEVTFFTTFASSSILTPIWCIAWCCLPAVWTTEKHDPSSWTSWKLLGHSWTRINEALESLGLLKCMQPSYQWCVNELPANTLPGKCQLLKSIRYMAGVDMETNESFVDPHHLIHFDSPYILDDKWVSKHEKYCKRAFDSEREMWMNAWMAKDDS